MSTTSVELMETQRDREDEDMKDTRSIHETSAPSSESVSEEEIDEEVVENEKECKLDENECRNPADSVFERISEEKTSTSVETSVRKSIAEEKETVAEKSTSSEAECILSGEDQSASNSTGSKSKPTSTKDDGSKKMPKSPERAPLKRMDHVPDTPTAPVDFYKDIGEMVKPAHNIIDMEVTEQTRVQEGIQSVLKSFPEERNKPSTIWSVDSISPSRVKSLLPENPNVERLLPIGPPREPSPKPVLFKSYTYHEHHHHHHSHSAKDKNLPPFLKSPGEMRLPSQERLLPIGPTQERSRSKSPLVPTTPSTTTPVPETVPELAESKAPTIDSQTDKNPEALSVEVPTVPEAVVIPIETVSQPVAAPMQLPLAKPDTIIKDDKSDKEKPNLTKKKKKKKEKEQEKKEQKDDKSSGSKSSSEKNGKKSEKSEPTTPKTSKNRVSAQSTLESLGQSVSIDMKDEGPGSSGSHQKNDPSGKQRYKQRRQRKTGVTSAEVQRSVDSKGGQSVASGGVAAGVQRRARKTDPSPSSGLPSKRSSTSQSSAGAGGAGCGTPTTAPSDHDGIHERCLTCNNVYQEFSEEEIGMCIVILRTFIHREPSLAASILPEILKLVSKFATYFPYPWMTERLVASFWF